MIIGTLSANVNNHLHIKPIVQYNKKMATFSDSDHITNLRRLIGKSVKKTRESAHVSRHALAEQLKLSYSAIAMWERGERFPTLPDIYAMAKLFRISLYDLLPNQPGASSAREVIDVVKLAMQADEFRIRDEAHRELEAAARRFLQVTRVTENWQTHDDGGISFSRHGRRKVDSKDSVAEKPRKVKSAA